MRQTRSSNWRDYYHLAVMGRINLLFNPYMGCLYHILCHAHGSLLDRAKRTIDQFQEFILLGRAQFFLLLFIALRPRSQSNDQLSWQQCLNVDNCFGKKKSFNVVSSSDILFFFCIIILFFYTSIFEAWYVILLLLASSKLSKIGLSQEIAICDEW